MNRRVAFFGGSFDPPHIGHLLVAEHARETLGLKRVNLLVTAQSPHRDGKSSTASALQRLAMARLAVQGNTGLGVDDREIRRGGKSYTIDTARELAGQHPQSRPLFIIGGDMLADLPRWRAIHALLEIADFAPVFRPGHGREVLALLRRRLGRVIAARLESLIVRMPSVEISSSDIRARIGAGRSVRYLTPDSVIRFIRRRRLYRPAADRTS